MDDRDLNKLKDIEIPTPLSTAKQGTIRAALLSFEVAHDQKTKKKKDNSAHQGSNTIIRLISTIVGRPMEWIMQRRVIAASLITGVLLIPMGAYLMQPSHKPMAPIGMFDISKEQELRSQLNEKDKQPKKIAKSEYDGLARQDNKDTESGKSKHLRPGYANRQPTKPANKPMSIQGGDAKSLGGKRARTTAVKPNDGKKQSSSSTFHSLGTVYDRVSPSPETPSRDRFKRFESNPVKAVSQTPVSTFSIDVDTASYAFVRRMLENGRLPSKDAIRVEELINYFSYDYPYPEGAETPFRPSVSVYPTPWNSNTKIVHIGIKGYDIIPDEKPRSNIVFLIDVSGSMSSRDKLPLLKTSFRLLIDRLEADDTVAIVTYAGRAGTILEPTKVKDKYKILSALNRLESGGSTAGAQGIRRAYELAESVFDKEGVNRVILATDGDFNVGITDHGELKNYIKRKRKSGIFLSVLGFGQGNYNDALMQVLAQNGNGNAAYIDTLKEAQKVLVEEVSSTLFTIAKDVKIQIEFNPALVSEYRLIGYETRKLKRADFNNDKVDAGDIGSGHTVTALYEITPSTSNKKLIDDLRYQTPGAEKKTVSTNEYAFLKMRYKLPKQSNSKLLTIPIIKDMEQSLDSISSDMRFAVSIAAFGQKLRGNTHLEDYGYDKIRALAANARGKDPFGYRSEFLRLIDLAKSLTSSAATKPKAE